MNPRYSRRLTLWLSAVISTLTALAAKSQVADVEPRWLRLDIPQASLGMEAEGLSENETIYGVSSTHQQLSLAPVVGLQTSGSIYHPNLLSFNLSGEDGWGWVNDSVNSPGSTSTLRESDNLLRYQAQASLLPNKPYNATFSAAQDQTYRTYDAFNSYTVDSTRDNAHFAWDMPALELNLDLGYRDETSSGIGGSTEVAEELLNFYGTQKRPNGQSTLTYRYDNFDNTLDSSTHQDSILNSIGISDSEILGTRRQINVSTGAGFSESQSTGQQTKTFTANENITDKLGPSLNSYLMLNGNHSSQNSMDSSEVQLTSGLRHQLYDSLTTTLNVHGNYDKNTSSSSSTATDRYGVGLNEDYIKRLGDWGRLSAGAGITVDHQDDNSSGGVLTVFNESHNLTNTPAMLNNPQVITPSIQVWAAADNYPYVEGTDYTIVTSGELTGVQLVLGSMNVALHGSAVVVNYQSESLNNDSFESVNSSVQIRLDVLNHLGIYGRVNKLDNNAPPEVLTQTLTDLTAGMDFTWQWFRANAEYQDYNSNYTQYQAWRFLQSLNYQLSVASRFGVDVSENFYRYAGGLNQDQYQFVARYNTQLDFSLAWYVEGGYVLYDLTGTQQDSAFARTGLSWSRGKLSLRAGYEYNYQTTTAGPSTEETDRHYFFASLKRTF